MNSTLIYDWYSVKAVPGWLKCITNTYDGHPRYGNDEFALDDLALEEIYGTSVLLIMFNM